MKNTFLVALCGIFLCSHTTLKAQSEQGTNELRVQISDGLPLAVVSSLTLALADAFGTAFSGHDIERDGNSSLPGLWSLGYRHYVTPRFSVGADVGYMNQSSKYILTKEGEADRKGERKNTFILILPTAEYSYMNRPKVQLYGNLGAGVNLLSGYSTVASADRHDYSATTFAFQFNPIGVRFGQRFGGFAELGFGFKGIFTAGFSVRL